MLPEDRKSVAGSTTGSQVPSAESAPLLGQPKKSMLERVAPHMSKFRLASLVLALSSAGLQANSIANPETASTKELPPYFLFGSFMCFAGANFLNKDLYTRIFAVLSAQTFIGAAIAYHYASNQRINPYVVNVMETIGIFFFIGMFFTVINPAAKLTDKFKSFNVNPAQTIRNSFLTFAAVLNITALIANLDIVIKDYTPSTLVHRMANDLIPWSFVAVIWTVQTLIGSLVKTEGHTAKHNTAYALSWLAFLSILGTAIATTIEDIHAFSASGTNALPFMIAMVTGLMAAAEYLGSSPLRSFPAPLAVIVAPVTPTERFLAQSARMLLAPFVPSSQATTAATSDLSAYSTGRRASAATTLTEYQRRRDKAEAEMIASGYNSMHHEAPGSTHSTTSGRSRSAALLGAAALTPGHGNAAVALEGLLHDAESKSPA